MACAMIPPRASTSLTRCPADPADRDFGTPLQRIYVVGEVTGY